MGEPLARRSARSDQAQHFDATAEWVCMDGHSEPPLQRGNDIADRLLGIGAAMIALSKVLPRTDAGRHISQHCFDLAHLPGRTTRRRALRRAERTSFTKFASPPRSCARHSSGSTNPAIGARRRQPGGARGRDEPAHRDPDGVGQDGPHSIMSGRGAARLSPFLVPSSLASLRRRVQPANQQAPRSRSAQRQARPQRAASPRSERASCR